MADSVADAQWHASSDPGNHVGANQARANQARANQAGPKQAGPKQARGNYEPPQAQPGSHPPGAAGQPCAGAIVHDDDGRLLLVQRRNPPNAGSWSIPGGRCDPGEEAEDCCVREVGEETGLRVTVVRWVGRVSRPGIEGAGYLIDDFLCRVTGGALHSGSDATAVRWVDAQQLRTLTLVPGLITALTQWALLPAPRPSGTGAQGVRRSAADGGELAG